MHWSIIKPSNKEIPLSLVDSKLEIQGEAK